MNRLHGPFLDTFLIEDHTETGQTNANIQTNKQTNKHKLVLFCVPYKEPRPVRAGLGASPSGSFGLSASNGTPLGTPGIGVGQVRVGRGVQAQAQLIPRHQPSLLLRGFCEAGLLASRMASLFSVKPERQSVWDCIRTSMTV